MYSILKMYMYLCDIIGEKLKASTTKNKKQRRQIDEPRERTKRDHAVNYIYDLAVSDVVDKSAYQNQDNSIYLPYRTVDYFYGEYLFYCDFNGIIERASSSTFRRAYQEAVALILKQEKLVLKLSGGKGTCFII